MALIWWPVQGGAILEQRRASSEDNREVLASPARTMEARREFAVRQAESALIHFATSADAHHDPLVVAALDLMRGAGMPVEVRRLLAELARSSTSYGRDNAKRYRWGLSWRAEPGHRSYAAQPPGYPVHWRPAEFQRLNADPSAYGQRLMEPIVLASQFGFWGRLARDPSTDPEISRLAMQLLDEAAPTAEHGVATWFAADDPWRDTFGLWLLSREPETMSRLRDLLFSSAVRYGAIAARHGTVRGTRYPFYDLPLVSASAHLAAGLWRFGIYPTVVPTLVEFVGSSRDGEGGWADPRQRADVLTTLAAADLLASLDPDFDPLPTLDWFMRRQEAAGWWRALNPEVPWLTAQVVGFARLAARPFSDRFAWPASPIWAQDRLSRVTTLATLEELELVLSRLSALGRQRIELGFVDLAGFGAWNSAHGQASGDRVIELLGKSLTRLPDALPVRIGGDEFMLLGKPAGESGRLAATLDAWRAGWPAELAAAEVTGVAPRILIQAGPARDLRRLRESLGQAIDRLKKDAPQPPPTGIQQTLPDLAA